MIFYENFTIDLQLILGPAMNVMNSIASQDITKTQGRYFQAAQFSGMLRCSLYGDISHITLFTMDSSEIIVRNQNGSQILELPRKRYYRRSIV